MGLPAKLKEWTRKGWIPSEKEWELMGLYRSAPTGLCCGPNGALVNGALVNGALMCLKWDFVSENGALCLK